MTLEEREFQGVPFAIDVSRAQDPAWFVLGVRKSGSSMFNRACRLLAKFNEVNWIDVPGTMFQANVSADRWRGRTELSALVAGGNAYGGFRDCPDAIISDPGFVAARKVLLVRDPRDALVSEYFSNRGTHSLPPEGAPGGARAQMLQKRAAASAITVEDFARSDAPRMAQTLAAYARLRDDPRLLLLRYEDVVFEKGAMLDAVVAHFGWTLKPRKRDVILGWIDTFPDAEDEHAFIRKVTPGDHREKLSPATLAAIAPVLAPAMAAFGYD